MYFYKNYSDFVEAIKNESGRTILQDIVTELRTAETLSVDDKVKKFKLPPLQEEKFEVQPQQQYQPPVQQASQPDSKAEEWAEANPKDPRSAKIKARLTGG